MRPFGCCTVLLKGDAMGKTQMNVRLDEDVKTAGDKLFAELGYTPTQVVNDKRFLQHCPYAAVNVEDAIKLLEL